MHAWSTNNEQSFMSKDVSWSNACAGRLALVYDVTKFLEDHPGGDDVLLSSTGKDATDDFEDVGGHSNTARAMMDEYLVGEVDDPF
uniref:Cytochrome b5 heme-binding domain-containing protein n=1 Tax=Zea mays TaxID=4577 RepID=A0A804PRN6_MAIZE